MATRPLLMDPGQLRRDLENPGNPVQGEMLPSLVGITSSFTIGFTASGTSRPQ